MMQHAYLLARLSNIIHEFGGLGASRLDPNKSVAYTFIIGHGNFVYNLEF